MKIDWTQKGRRMHKQIMAFATILASGLLTINPAVAGSISRIEADGSEITISFDDLVEGASAFSLVGPNRIAIDVRGGKAGQGGYANGIVKAVRQGQYDINTARIVFDLDRPAVITNGSFSNDGKRLSLSMRSVGQSQISSGRQSFLPPVQFRAEPPRKSYSVKVPLGKPQDSVRLPKIYGPNDSSRPLVVIDAGHGGHDPGTVSPHGGKYEKNVVLAIAIAVRDRLIAGGQVRVALTRDTDSFLVLEERYGIARRLGADLFISIHADAAGNEEASGATVYTLSEVASDREAAKLAARENKANIINGINLGGATHDVSSILIDLTQRETMNVSADFAKLLHRETSRQMTFRKIPHRYASFVVLKAPDTPSVLFETGYLTNKDDVAFLNSRQGRTKVAAGVASAIESHFARKLALR
ncbi:MAG: AMIN domain-containing protein [Sphingomonadales bacterium]|nr:AMIN domain-containing protein [Sphingomonadales bacterium]PIX64280.1 MAG: N-acetylmuramoyl-L-alanine amidase [Sphingomonadales bacterium CG_4_10_14_3_um_filter_58_15]NCO50038.1 AMIN domain-containing protein [Sphingomonadales bacterium]NCO99957.1 AMIN domain-containing protein [Sphingomonadales bacterium]NCP25937.1 AMIN domain-containing protein [Sphingomonadales bacterium]